MRGQLFRMKKFEAEQHPDSEISVNSHVEKYYPQASRSARKLLKNIMVAESGYNARVVVARLISSFGQHGESCSTTHREQLVLPRWHRLLMSLQTPRSRHRRRLLDERR